METLLFTGKLVRLAALNPETDAEAIAHWSRDSEYWRLKSPSPARPSRTAAVRQRLEDRGEEAMLAIRTLADDRFIGQIGLWTVPPHGDAWVGIHIGEREYWGRGYGSDAMRVMLRYAFTELNLQRVSLDALATNARAIRSYEKCGFVVEGYTRQAARYDGRYFDEVYMGILRDEWDAKRQA